MTKMINHVLNLPEIEDLLRETDSDTVDTDDELDYYTDVAVKSVGPNTNLSNINDKFLEIKEGDGHSKAMDEIHKESLKTARDLVDLGFNVDSRSAATIFEKAIMAYKVATDAKNSKRDMQLKAMKIFIDSNNATRKLDLEERRLQSETGDKVYDTDASVVDEDRNDLIRKIRAQIKAEQER